MTLVRDGWIDGRGYYVARDPDTGEALKYICEDCGAELAADPDIFDDHLCENFRDGPTFAVTDAAADLAQEKEIDLSDVEGTGTDGRILKSDIERVMED